MNTTKNKQKKLLQILLEGKDIGAKKALFVFDHTTPDWELLIKFQIWARYHHPKFFTVKDAPFHKEMDESAMALYRRNKKEFINLAFRGASKTTRLKLFIAFVIANDLEHTRKYFKVLSFDSVNSKQFVTDIYNLLISHTVKEMYPEVFKKTTAKREETMSSFTTSTGIKVIADTVGSSQRGSIQEEARPDFIVFDDFETRETLRSAVKTKAIWDNMQEARDGLAVDGVAVYLGNYISELGNVHKLVERATIDSITLVVPIVDDEGIKWPERYTEGDIKALKASSDDFEGEYLSQPSASRDIYYDRETLDNMAVLHPMEEIAGFKIYKEYKPSHRYAGGHDIAGGVGLDSSTSVFIDFSTVPAQVVGTFVSNTIDPEAFGDEIYLESKRFGKCLIAPENNKYDQAILKARQLGANIHTTKRGQNAKTITTTPNTPNVYGWETNALTKSNMMNDFRNAVNDGLIALNDQDLINECKSYTRNDLIDKEPDPRLITRHFDLLIAGAIAWQMKDYAEAEDGVDPYAIIPHWEEEEAVENVAE
jgi:hypothetical protein